MSDIPRLPPLSPAEARRLDQTCDRFEAAWKTRQRPRPEEYLGTAGEPERSALLRQLLLLDWDYRLGAGDGPSVAEYVARFPGDAALVEAVGRELSESANSTQVGSDEPRVPDTLRLVVAAPDLPEEAGAAPQAAVDRYGPLQQVGHGGIGIVFRGRDRVLGRELAVKVLRAAYQDNPDARRRFIEEARVGSQLQHPSIVPVYELGWSADRRPYFTMKLVEGHTLAELLQGRPDSAQDLPRLLGIFEQVCQAMAYAHARGVVHRDLKPSNVMVGAFGEVQVMDWGFDKRAVASDQWPVVSEERDGPSSLTTGHGPLTTAPGALMGTPAYMPPEQARGEAALVDSRADVFALGAMLCEILTSRPPYVGDTADEVCHKAAAGDLADAQARLDACGADAALRELARRCLAAERSARPPDAGVVARDLTAYLASAQERLRQAQLERAAAEARAQEAGAKAKAERRARRLTLALAAAALLLVLGAAAAPAIAYVLLQAEQQQTEAQRQAAVAAREDEARRRRQARQALDLLSGPVIEDWLSKQPLLSRHEHHFLEQALAVYTAFAADTSTDEASQAAVARASSQVGDIQWLLRRLPEAEAAYDRGAALYTRLSAEAPSRPEYRKGLAQLLNNRLLVLQATGRGEQVDAALRDLVRLERALVAEAPDTDSRTFLAFSLNHLGIRCQKQGKLQEAEALVRESLALYQKLAAEPPAGFAARHGLARTRSNLGRVLAARGRPAEAEGAYRTAQKEQEELTAQYPNGSLARRDLGNTHTLLAELLCKTRRNQDAEAAYQEALKVRRELVADFPGRPALYEDLAGTHLALGIVLTALGRDADAAAVYRSVLALYEKFPAELSKQLNHRRARARAWFNLGPLLAKVKGPQEGEAAAREARRLYQALADEKPAEPEYQHYLASSLDNLAGWAHQRGERAEARRLVNEALPHHRAAVQAKPSSKDYRQRLCMNRFSLALTFLADKQHEGLADAAGQLAEAAAPELPSEIKMAAALLARCVTLAEQDAGLPEARRAELAGAYGERSVKTLRLAVKHGYRETARLRTDGYFAPVRSRPDFQELLAEVEKTAIPR